MYYREMTIAEFNKSTIWGRRYLVESTQAGWVRISRLPLIPVTETLYYRATDDEVDLFACTKFEHTEDRTWLDSVCLCNFPAGTIPRGKGNNPLIPSQPVN